MNFHPVSIIVGCCPPELRSAIAQCVEKVPACRLVELADGASLSSELLDEQNAGMLVYCLPEQSDDSELNHWLKLAAGATPPIPVVAIANGELGWRFGEILRMGACDVLERPLNLSRLSFLIDFLTLQPRSTGERLPRPISAPIADPYCGELLFASEQSRALLGDIQRLAQVPTTVLLTGETGTGKTSVARLLHELSQRRNEPFIVVNCGALPESLLESELFGHRQGSFTGAARDHCGKFCLARGGTIFLDEIDALSLTAQSRLLRVISDRCYEAVGSEETKKLEARMVFASNRDLAVEVQQGRFRHDLYYRLNVIALSLPPLRSRRTEISGLVENYLQDFRSRKLTSVYGFSNKAMVALSAYDWPGNLRELRNVVERVAVFARGRVADITDLPTELQNLPLTAKVSVASKVSSELDESGASLSEVRRLAEKRKILRTLEKCGDNRSRAADILGISRAAFYKKLRYLGLV